jgi:hypothetical protein
MRSIEDFVSTTVDEDEEWDPSSDTDDSQTPVVMIVNSNQMRAPDFDLREARLTIKLDRLMIVSNQAFSAGFCMYH